MGEFFSINHIKALRELISPKNEDSDSEEDIQKGRTAKLGPGDIGPTQQSSPQNIKPAELLKSDNQDIWCPSETTNSQNSEIIDPRKVPEYEIKFKQAVTTEDIFLGIGFKTPASASCEWLSIYIKLPGEERENIKLNVESECVDIRSPKYRLHLPTSHIVDPNASSAKWHCDSSTLELTLRMIRELDAVNF